MAAIDGPRQRTWVHHNRERAHAHDQSREVQKRQNQQIPEASSEEYSGDQALPAGERVDSVLVALGLCRWRWVAIGGHAREREGEKLFAEVGMWGTGGVMGFTAA